MEKEIKQKKKREEFKVYCCYSNKQKEYLLSKGYRYEVIARDVNSLDQFWLFLRCDGLNKALDEYSEIKRLSNCN